MQATLFGATLFRGLVLGLCLATAGPAMAAMSEWSEAANVRVRLVAMALNPAGRPNAALQIELAPGWKTYWRSPGDAGIPPSFDFTGSKNFAKADVGYPPPERIDDGYAVSNIYSGAVTLPLTVLPVNASEPVELSLKLDLGVCEDVCVPVSINAAVTISPSGDDADADAVLSAAVRSLPDPPLAGTFAIGAVKRVGGDDDNPMVEFEATVPDPSKTLVFVEGPADWYPDVPKPLTNSGKTITYRVSFDRLGSKTPLAKADLRFTVVSGDRAMEETVKLD